MDFMTEDDISDDINNDIVIYQVLTDDYTPLAQLACEPHQLDGLMRQEFPRHPYRVEGSTVVLFSGDTGMSTTDIEALPEQLTLNEEIWSVVHVGGRPSVDEMVPRTILVEAAPLQDWAPGRRPTAQMFRDWIRDPGLIVDDRQEMLIDLNNQLIYLLGTWTRDTPDRLRAVTEHLEQGTLNPLSYGLRELASRIATVQNAEHERLRARSMGLEVEIQQIRRHLTQRLRELETIRRFLATPAPTVEIGNILQRVREVDGVTGLSVDGPKVLIETSPITILNRNVNYDIGRFLITINIIDGDIHFTNLTRQVRGTHHPHISSSGNACFGEISAAIPELMSGFMLVELITVLIRYLRSVNDRDSAGRHIVDWPRVGAPPALRLSFPSQRVQRQPTVHHSRSRFDDLEDDDVPF